MKHITIPLLLTPLLVTGVGLYGGYAYRTSDTEFEPIAPKYIDAPFTMQELYRDWERPEGPLRVGLQVGHWNNTDVPDELDGIRGNVGAIGGGKYEWEVNYAIAQETKKLLAPYDIEVDILEAVIPPRYLADLFVAIHADASDSQLLSGFKIASPWRDITGKGNELVDIFESSYAEATDMPMDSHITSRMRGYYAFNWRKYEHSIHPMTPAVIVETGFLTSPVDQRILIHQPEVSAQGIADAVLRFLKHDASTPMPVEKKPNF